MSSNPHSFNRLALLPQNPQKKQVTQLAVLGDCLSKEQACPDGRILSVLCLQNWPVDLGAVAKQCSSLCRMASLLKEHIFNWEPSTCLDSENYSLKNQKWNIYLELNGGRKDGNTSQLCVPVHHRDKFQMSHVYSSSSWSGHTPCPQETLKKYGNNLLVTTVVVW